VAGMELRFNGMEGAFEISSSKKERKAKKDVDSYCNCMNMKILSSIGCSVYPKFDRSFTNV